jgi:hypothetical protein
MNIIERILAPMPSLFKALRNGGLALIALSAVILLLPAAFPPVLVSIAGYVAVGACVLSIVSQLTVDDRASPPPDPGPPEPEIPPLVPIKGKGKGKAKQVHDAG